MSASQWLVIALNVGALIAMVTAFAVSGWREVRADMPTGDENLPPLTPGWEYREGYKTL